MVVQVKKIGLLYLTDLSINNNKTVAMVEYETTLLAYKRI